MNGLLIDHRGKTNVPTGIDSERWRLLTRFREDTLNESFPVIGAAVQAVASQRQAEQLRAALLPMVYRQLGGEIDMKLWARAAEVVDRTVTAVLSTEFRAQVEEAKSEPSEPAPVVEWQPEGPGDPAFTPPPSLAR